MMARLLILLLLLAFVIRASGDTPTSMPEEVSLMQLIATTERYDGKQVQVVGFLRLEFEGNGLYLHEEDYKRHYEELAMDCPEPENRYGKQSAKHALCNPNWRFQCEL